MGKILDEIPSRRTTDGNRKLRGGSGVQEKRLLHLAYISGFGAGQQMAT